MMRAPSREETMAAWRGAATLLFALPLLWLTGCICPTGQISCDGTCADPITSSDHCGACGRACASTERCEDARCVLLPECGPTADSPRSCDDGNLCNGIHECRDGRCTSIASPVTCTDSVSCTDSQCNPATGWCEHVPNDTLCDEGSVCDPTRGCETRCLYSPCGVVAQCGCFPEDTCSPTGACVVAGDREVGSACARTADCAHGLVCLGGVTDEWHCSEPCARSTDCSSGRCLSELGIVTNSPTGERVSGCENVCDPVNSTGCYSGQVCAMFGSDSDARTVCTTADRTGTAGAACTGTTDPCARGHACVSYTTGTFCGKLCYNDYDCPSGRRCLNFDPNVIVRGRVVGVCG